MEEDIKILELNFLQEYEKLCQKYKMGLQGCGCCGSPFLNKINNINYNETLNCIFIGGNGYYHEIEKKGDEIDEFCRKGYEQEKTIQNYFN